MKTVKLLARWLDEPPSSGFFSASARDFPGPGIYLLAVRAGDKDASGMGLGPFCFPIAGGASEKSERATLVYLVDKDAVQWSGVAAPEYALDVALARDPGPVVAGGAPFDVARPESALLLRALAVCQKPELVLDMFPARDAGAHE